MWLFCYFNFERNYGVLKSKSPYILLNNDINFRKNKTESKMKNPTYSFRETNLLLQKMVDVCEGIKELGCNSYSLIKLANIMLI